MSNDHEQDVLAAANPIPEMEWVEPLDSRAESELDALLGGRGSQTRPGAAPVLHLAGAKRAKRRPRRIAFTLTAAAAAAIVVAGSLLLPGPADNEAVAGGAPALVMTSSSLTKQQAVQKLVQTATDTPDGPTYDHDQFIVQRWEQDTPMDGAKGKLAYLPTKTQRIRNAQGQLVETTTIGKATDEAGRNVEFPAWREGGGELQPGSTDSAVVEPKKWDITPPETVAGMKKFVAHNQATGQAVFSDNKESGLFEVLGWTMMDWNYSAEQSIAALKLIGSNSDAKLAGKTKDRLGRDSTAFTVTTHSRYGIANVTQYYLLFENETGRLGSFEEKYIEGSYFPANSTVRYVATEDLPK